MNKTPSSVVAAIALAAATACAQTAGTASEIDQSSGAAPMSAAAPGTAPTSAAAPPPAAVPATSGQPASTPSTAAPTTAPVSAAAPTASSATPFRFVTWGDTKVASGSSAGAVLQALSDEAKTLSPPAAFTLYLGDLEETGFTDTAGLADDWVSRLDGTAGNGTSLITFASRGNHDAMDSSSIASWQGYFSFGTVAGRVGATHYAELDPEMTYSFDYGNAHFVSLDAPGDFPVVATSRELGWLEQDLATAEARGLTHAFLFWHGPIYTVTNGHPLDSGNPEQPIRDLVAIIGRHPIVSAIFAGHEHVLAYSHIGASRFPTLAVPHEFEQFTIGAGGASFHDPIAGRADAVVPYVSGFATVDVNGPAFTVAWHGQGSAAPQGTFTFTKATR